MEILSDNNLGQETPRYVNLLIDSNIADEFRKTVVWSKWVGIYQFIMAGFMAVLAILVFMVSGSPYLSASIGGVSIFVLFYGILYLAMAVLFFFIGYYVIMFSNQSRNALDTGDQLLMQAGITNMRRFFKISGILSMITVLMIILGVLICIIAAASFAAFM